MTLWVGVTDKDWFTFLAARHPDEVNFWQPGGTTPFKALKPGELFLFKLKSPWNVIAGGGFFVKYVSLPLSLTWDAFQENNGTASYLELRNKIFTYRARSGEREPDPRIGCIILTDPFFFDESLWIPQPQSWGRNIVQGKTYGVDEDDGKALYTAVQARLQFSLPNATVEIGSLVQPASEQGERYRMSQTKHRLGQGTFRTLVTEAYHWRCAATGERTLPVLEAAHIKPFAESGPHDVRNGVLLRSDLHTLFDLGYITISPDYRLEVSGKIKEEYENGREYYALQGKAIALPEQRAQQPLQKFLDWHNRQVFIP